MHTPETRTEYDIHGINGPWFARWDETDLAWWIHEQSNKCPVARFSYCDQAKNRARLAASAPDLKAENERLTTTNAKLLEALEDYYSAVAFQLGRTNPKESTPTLTVAAQKARAAIRETKGD